MMLALGFGAVAFESFRIIFRFIAMVFRHPIITGSVLLCLCVFGKILDANHVGAVNTVVALRGDRASVETMSGSPDSCAYDSGVETCSYNTFGSVSYLGSRVLSIRYDRLNGEQFNDNDAFYHHVLDYLELPYREPDHHDINMVAWTYPHVGTITVVSDQNMNVSKITIMRYE